jgi:aminoglycoside phosphotransferase (APT) family kinase protein
VGFNTGGQLRGKNVDIEWERICEIVDMDINTADRLFKCFDSQKTVEDIEIFTGGKRTTNYKIRLKESEQEFVLRIYPENDRSWHKEFKLQNTLKNYLPVPEMYYLNEDKLIIDKPFSIVQFLDGVTLDKHLAGNNRISELLAQNIGESLAIIHQKEFKGLLEENSQTKDGLPLILSWYDYLLNHRAIERLGTRIINKLKIIIHENNELLGQMAQNFVFSHGDFRPANIMVKDGRLIGIIDWEDALSAPDYFDIGQFTRYKEHLSEKAKNRFISGYNQNTRRPVGKDWEKLSKLMDLVNLLVFLDNEEEKPKLFSDMRNLIEKTLKILEQ